MVRYSYNFGTNSFYIHYSDGGTAPISRIELVKRVGQQRTNKVFQAAPNWVDFGEVQVMRTARARKHNDTVTSYLTEGDRHYMKSKKYR
jgi:hypothetical protein